MSGKSAILIAGPTASGKTALAIAVARALNGVVINADSMQVYRELRVLSARPTPDEEMLAPHRLYGVVPAAERFSVGKWLGRVEAELDAAWQGGVVPVVTGGTGLYFKALEEGLAPMPPVPDRVRAKWAARLRLLGAPALHRQLAVHDPLTAARLERHDGQRIVRALEVFDASGRTLGAWQADQGPAISLLAGARVVRFVLWPPRQALYERCDLRFLKMIEMGALDEAAAIKALLLDDGLPVMKALGVRQLIEHLRGHCTMDEATRASQTWTRRYAKRQMTWFRSNMISWNCLSAQDSEQILADVFAILRENELTP
jgi:tRNA dimethylallyltransferase